MSDTLNYFLRLPKFKHLEAGTVKEACALLSKYKGNSKVVAGGTDLLVSMKRREICPSCLINIKGIHGLSDIDYQRKTLRIGALATLNAVESSSVVQETFPILASACHQLGTPLIRNIGTIGGNLCNASPASETAPSLIALGAKVKMVGPKGERVIPLESFFAGPGETTLQHHELLTEIRVPSPADRTKGVYLKLPARTAIDIAAVSVAVVITVGARDHQIDDVKIVLGAVAPTPVRARQAEKALKGKRLSEELIEKASQTASGEATPISDIRASADYRKQMVKVLTYRAIKQLVD